MVWLLFQVSGLEDGNVLSSNFLASTVGTLGTYEDRILG